ncbi:hypothetical protein DFH11DRAFT_1602843 [Phellopilus nigrolimitatus]|nr:hypothetical protein DFH11DRAFT_1602843 [Phellopilus nigrolimitatus]
MNSPNLTLLASSKLVKQGAEAKVYKGRLHPPVASTLGEQDSEPVLLKYRFQKQYRHPALNASLTKSRIAGEARALMKCMRSGVRVPGIRMIDTVEGIIGIEWIEGKSIRALLGEDEESELQLDENTGEDDSNDKVDTVDLSSEFGVTQSEVMKMIGTELAKMHKADVIHGDLTTSNMMIHRPPQNIGEFPSEDKTTPAAELVLIDFGLSYVSSLAEDKAVDLYVLERAFASTHPDSEPLFALVLDAYAQKSQTDWKAVGKKLDEGILLCQSDYEDENEAWLDKIAWGMSTFFFNCKNRCKDW